jgi:hypothetical protein
MRAEAVKKIFQADGLSEFFGLAALQSAYFPNSLYLCELATREKLFDQVFQPKYGFIESSKTTFASRVRWESQR